MASISGEKNVKLLLEATGRAPLTEEAYENTYNELYLKVKEALL